MKTSLKTAALGLSVFVGSAAITAMTTQRTTHIVNITSPFLEAHAAASYPDATLTDVISYADQVSVVTVLAERQGASSEETLGNKEGYVPRILSARIDETLWTANGPTAVEGDVEIGTIGWHMKGGSLVELRIKDAPRLVVGGQYTIALSKAGDRKVAALNGRISIPVQGNDVAEKDAAERGVTALVESLRSKNATELAEALAAVERDPLVERFRALPPGQRIQAVLAEQEAAESRP